MTHPDQIRIITDSSKMVFVDFDHTLFGSNSTELFIAFCKPNFIASIIEFTVRRCIPWRLTGFEKWHRVRDYFCILILCIITPWNIILWHRRAPELFERYVAVDVVTRVKEISIHRLIILSFGFGFIIRALVAKSEFSGVRIVATPLFSGLTRFRHAKTWLAVAAVGDAFTKNATFITDSIDDIDLLNYCAQGIKIEQQGESFDARTALYIPLRYYVSAKYTIKNAVDRLCFVDTLIFILATAPSISSLWIYVLICPFFILSMMCIYEIGYFENDFKAAKKETAPTLKPNYIRFRQYPIFVAAWIWAAMIGILGILATGSLFQLSLRTMLIMVAYWTAALIAVRLVFAFYNTLKPERRIFVYPILQLTKYCSIFAIFSANTIGIVLIISQIITLWVNYIIYRFSGSAKEFAQERFRAAFLLLFMAVFILGSWSTPTPFLFALTNPDTVFNLLAVLMWSVFRVLKEAIMRRARAAGGTAPFKDTRLGWLTAK